MSTDQKLLPGTDRGTGRFANVTKVAKYKWRTDTRPGELMMIPKGSLEVDSAYQRGQNELKVQHIASSWSWPAFGALIVARRGDRFFVIDGQHRALAAIRRADVSDLPCVVFPMENIEQEALAFLDSNTSRKPLTTADKYKASLVVGDEVTTLVNNLIVASGRTVDVASKVGVLQLVNKGLREENELRLEARNG